MHSVQRSGRAARVRTDPARTWAGIDRFFGERLEALRSAGIGRERLITDPGLGYFLGSNPEPSLVGLAGIRHLKARFGLPVLVSPSRKSFVRTLTSRGIADSGPASLAAELYAAWQGADYIRTHDVASLHDALTVVHAIAGSVPHPARAATARDAPTANDRAQTGPICPVVLYKNVIPTAALGGSASGYQPGFA